MALVTPDDAPRGHVARWHMTPAHPGTRFVVECAGERTEFTHTCPCGGECAIYAILRAILDAP